MTDLVRYDQSHDGLKVAQLVINLLDPLVDAGDVMQTIDSTISTLDGVQLASFTSDTLYDYRAQRPIVDYEDGALVDFTIPQMRLMLYSDVTGKNFLYLCGHEPDFRWTAVAEEILAIIKKFGVEQVFSYAAMPATVPHTRPADMLIRSTSPIDSVSYVKASIAHYGSLSDYVEYLARDSAASVVNVRVRVPFYMARGPFPFVSGSLAALKMTASLGGPTLPLGDLEQIEDGQLAQGEQIAAQSPEFAELVHKLERDYDSQSTQLGFARTSDNLDIPSSDEIGRAAELFLEMQSENPLDRAYGEERRSENSLSGKDKYPGGKDFNFTQPAPRPRRGRHARVRDDNASTTRDAHGNNETRNE